MTVAHDARGSAVVRRQPYLAVIGAIAAAVLILVALVAYSMGAHKQTNERVLTGTAYVGQLQASVKVDGWYYGIEGSVPWRDAAGQLHASGWPSCLGTVGTQVRFRFAEVPVTGPDGSGSRQVLWVDCRGAAQVN